MRTPIQHRHILPTGTSLELPQTAQVSVSWQVS